MDARELRIGNLIFDKNEITVFGVANTENGEMIWYDKEGGFWLFINETLPIPLTEEWLLKFGFEVNQGASKRLDAIVYDFKGLRLKKFNGRMSKFFIEWGTGTRTYIVYVHKLQNVFYELNYEELEPKKA